MVLGLYGLIGSGKSTVSDYISKKYKFEIIDLDNIGKILIKKDYIIKQLALLDKDLLNNGEIDKKNLRTKMFSDENYWFKVNKIFWPEIKKETLKIIEKNKDKNIIVEGALLPMLFDKEIDYFLKIETSSLEINIKRVLVRNPDLNIKDLKYILDLQEQKLNYYKNDNIINDNNDDFKKYIKKIITKVMK